MLPKLDQPTYNITLPVSGKALKIRPYLVKEEKLLLMAMETKDVDEKVNLLFQVLQNVVLNEQLNVRTLTMPDILYLITKIRSYSKGEVLELVVTCQNEITSSEDSPLYGSYKKKCDHKNHVEVSIENAKLSGEMPNGKISLTGSIGVKLNPPSGEFLANAIKGQKMSAISDDMFYDMLEYTWDADQVYNKRDTTREEVIEFFESMNDSQLQQVADYANSIPDIIIKFDYKCSECGNKDTVILSSKDINRFLV